MRGGWHPPLGEGLDHTGFGGWDSGNGLLGAEDEYEQCMSSVYPRVRKDPGEQVLSNEMASHALHLLQRLSILVP